LKVDIFGYFDGCHWWISFVPWLAVECAWTDACPTNAGRQNPWAVGLTPIWSRCRCCRMLWKKLGSESR